MRRSRSTWAAYLTGFIAVGILSRVVHTGVALFDKHLGDALYAAMIYVILRLIWPTSRVALRAMAVMTAIELFQLTKIAANMLSSPHVAVRIVARLMGTTFSFGDLLVYALVIGAMWLLDERRPSAPRN